MVRVACIGECMIELSEHADGTLTRSYGGDTLNTALYMARLGTPVDYVTALGDDGWSDEMLAMWRAEGIGTDKVLRLPGRLPGLYVIQTDAAGERRFQYWRDSAAARDLFTMPEKTPALIEALARDYTLLYLSGITLSLYGDAGRAVLFTALDMARAAESASRSIPISARAAGRTVNWRAGLTGTSWTDRTSPWRPPRIWTCCSAKAAAKRSLTESIPRSWC